MNSADKTLELLQQLKASKKNLSDTLVSKGEEASEKEPFDDLVQKAADYIPKSYLFVDEKGNEVAGVLVSQETVFDAVENDVREGKVFATATGVKTGEKFIPSYVTQEGYSIVTGGSQFEIKSLQNLDRYDFTKLQVLICPFNKSIAESVATEKVAINENVYLVNSSEIFSTVSKDTEKKYINLGFKNESETLYLIRYFTYKEIY